MKKLLILVSSLFIMAANVFALPGVEQFLPDLSGEYIYYRDYSFNRESYVGFLTYDKSTFAARYFAPATDSLPYKNVELVFTIDSSKNYIDMTGERFLTPITQDDTEIINYIHDLVYEFSARRKKAGPVEPGLEGKNSRNPLAKFTKGTTLIGSGLYLEDDFHQFGGKVFIYYDWNAPIFNIKQIVNNSGDSVFEAVATGIIKSSDDRSFSEFIPINSSPSNVVHKLKVKPDLKKEVTVEKSILTIDDNWQNAGSFENVFFMGDAAMIRTYVIDSKNFYRYIRSALYSTKDAYNPWNKISIIQGNSRIIVHSKSYTSTEVYEVANVILLKNSLLSEGENTTLLLSVTSGDYEANRKYFINILKKWK